jgi:MoaE-MoaD fusion protein
MDFKVLLFANFRERVGEKQVQVSLPAGALVSDLRSKLVADYPVLDKLMDSALVAVNRQFAFDDEVLQDGAEVAIFPPVSGGAGSGLPTFFAITEAELDLDELVRQITLPSTGAACVFTGMVRGITSRSDPHTTNYLEYEAYQPMAEAKLKQVAEEIRQRWPLVQGISIVQRIGRLNPGTPTVLIACSSAHRDDGVFEAARYGIDRLKEIVPIWKKEVGLDGEEWVEGEYIPGKLD